MRIFGFQLDIAWEAKGTNLAKVQKLLEVAQPEAGALVVLPEMFATGFSMNVAGICEGTPPEVELLRERSAAGLWRAEPAGRSSRQSPRGRRSG